jgi:hypothetical protein
MPNGPDRQLHRTAPAATGDREESIHHLLTEIGAQEPAQEVGYA